MPNHCHFSCVCECVCQHSTRALVFGICLLSTESFCVRSFNAVLLRLSLWLIILFRILGESKSIIITIIIVVIIFWLLSASYVQCSRFPIPVAPTAIVHDVNTKAKSKLTRFMFQCAEVCSLCKIGSVLVCLYVCLITRKAIIKHQCICILTLYAFTEWVKSK